MGKKEVRRKFRDDVFARDAYKCRICGIPMVEGLHPDDLYKIIGSSKELAIEKSNKL